jgi:excisionase family DNA binding protein
VKTAELREDTGRRGSKKTSALPHERRAWRVNEFCEAHRISRSTVYKLIAQGKLETVCVAGRRLIPDESARALMQNGAT